MPQTEQIPRVEITQWMFGIVQDQREAEAQYDSNKFNNIDLTSMIEESTRGSKQRTNSTGSSSSARTSKPNSECSESPYEKKRSARFSENSESGGDTMDVSI